MLIAILLHAITGNEKFIKLCSNTSGGSSCKAFISDIQTVILPSKWFHKQNGKCYVSLNTEEHAGSLHPGPFSDGLTI